MIAPRTEGWLDLARSVRDSLATGVTVVTMSDSAGPRGITIGACTAVSGDPPLVAICVRHAATSCDALASSGRFTTNILAEDQRDVAEFFATATPHRNRMGGFRHHAGNNGLAHIDGALAWLDCEIVRATDHGEHRLFLAAVVAAAVNRPEAGPLLYFHSEYRQGFTGATATGAMDCITEQTAASR